MTSSPMALMCWATRATMVSQQEARLRGQANPQKIPQFGLHLQLERMAGITSNRISVHGECVPGLVHTVTPCGWFTPRQGLQTLDHGIVSDWGEVVTR